MSVDNPPFTRALVIIPDGFTDAIKVDPAETNPEVLAEVQLKLGELVYKTAKEVLKDGGQIIRRVDGGPETLQFITCLLGNYLVHSHPNTKMGVTEREILSPFGSLPFDAAERIMHLLHLQPGDNTANLLETTRRDFAARQAEQLVLQARRDGIFDAMDTISSQYPFDTMSMGDQINAIIQARRHRSLATPMCPVAFSTNMGFEGERIYSVSFTPKLDYQDIEVTVSWGSKRASIESWISPTLDRRGLERFGSDIIDSLTVDRMEALIPEVAKAAQLLPATQVN